MKEFMVVVLLGLVIVGGWIWYDERLDTANERIEVLEAADQTLVEREEELRRRLDACGLVLDAARRATSAHEFVVLELYDEIPRYIAEAYDLGQAQNPSEANALARLVSDEEAAFLATLSNADPALSWGPSNELVSTCQG